MHAFATVALVSALVCILHCARGLVSALGSGGGAPAPDNKGSHGLLTGDEPGGPDDEDEEEEG